jgi:hypothetical protein
VLKTCVRRAAVPMRWVIAASLALACLSAPVLAAEQVQATILHFQIKPVGQAAYSERVLVTPDFLRFDGGDMGGVYVLFNRRTQTIYSVSPQDKDVLTIRRRPVKVKPHKPLELRQTSQPYKDAPSIDGKRPQHHTFFAGGKRCYEVVAVPGLLEDVRRALAAFRTTLAGQQALDYGRTPAPPQSACEQARLIFAPTRYLAHGFPIQGWGPQGKARRLLDFKLKQPVAAALFQLPTGYRYYTVDTQGMHDIPAPGS